MERTSKHARPAASSMSSSKRKTWEVNSMAPVFFKSPEHRLRWLYVLQTMGKVHAGKIDQEYGAALYGLTADLDTWQQAQMYVDRHGFDVEALHGIDFPELLAKGEFSGGYTVLIQWAVNLI